LHRTIYRCHAVRRETCSVSTDKERRIKISRRERNGTTEVRADANDKNDGQRSAIISVTHKTKLRIIKSRATISTPDFQELSRISLLR
jgi:hypothetical protein